MNLFPDLDEPTSRATISDDGVYRFELARRWAPGHLALWVMLNPSTADADADDPTIRRCVGFTKRLGLGGLVVVNLFALRATNPKALRTHPDPVGEGNDGYIRRWSESSKVNIIIAAWGRHGSLLDRSVGVSGTLIHEDRRVWCLGRTKSGEPRHPLYLSAATDLDEWTG